MNETYLNFRKNLNFFDIDIFILLLIPKGRYINFKLTIKILFLAKEFYLIYKFSKKFKFKKK